MSHPAPISSVASIGGRISKIAGGHLDRLIRHIVRGSSITTDDRMARLITGEPHPFGNFVIFADGVEREEIPRRIEPLTMLDVPAGVFFPGAVTGSVAECVVELGFEPHGAMPAMAADISALTRPELPEGYTFSRVGRGGASDDWARGLATGYEIPIGLAELFAPNTISGGEGRDASVRCYAIRNAGGKVVCTSMLFPADGVGGIYCVSTVPEERGRGLGAYATVQPLREAHEMGYRVGVLQSSPQGHSVYARAGFVDVGEVPMFVRIPGAGA